MKILVDPQIFWWQKFGGVSRYHTELIKHLDHREDLIVDCPILFHHNIYLEELSLFSNNRYLLALDRLLRFKGAGPLRRFFLNQKRYAIKNIKRQDYDLFVTTFYDNYFMDHIGEIPFVITIHDLIHENHPKFHSEYSRIAGEKKRLLSKASGIIAISETTKKELIKT